MTGHLTKNLTVVEKFLQNEAYESALEVLLPMLKSNPNEPEIYKNMGWIAFKQEKMDEAETYFNQALSLDENNPDYVYNLGWLYFYNNKLELAKEQYEKTIALLPDYALPYINLGAIYYESKDYEKALTHYLKAVSINSEDLHLLNNLGDTYNKLCNYSSAITIYELIVKLDPDNARAYGNLAITYNELGNFTKAEELCYKALSINPNSINANFNLANFYYQQTRYDDALQYILSAQNLTKHLNKDIIDLTIQIKKKLNLDYNEELNILEKIINEDPLTYHIIEQNHYRVIDILLERLENNINDFFHLSQLAYTLSQLGRYEESRRLFEYCISLNNTESWTLQHYAFALSKCNEQEEAINYYKRALEIAPYAIWPRKQLAEVLIETGKQKEAEKEINKVIEYSDNIDNKELLSEIFSIKAKIREKESFDDAIDWYMMALKYNEEESYNYERVSSLLATKYPHKVSSLKSIQEELASNKDEAYMIASGNQRIGNIIKSIEIYKDTIENNIQCYPAYVGISQALYEKKFNIITLNEEDYNKANLAKFVTNWEKLSPFEQNIVFKSVLPLQSYLDTLIEKDGSLTFIPINSKLTSLPELNYLQTETYTDGTPYQGIRALGGLNAYVGIERLRDITWKVPNWLKQVPATIAHEYAHQIYEILSPQEQHKINNIFKTHLNDSLSFISEYSKTNHEEFFAEYFAYFSRKTLHFGKCPINNEILDFINNLDYNN